MSPVRSDELLKELAALPPEQVAALLREVLDRSPTRPPDRAAWKAAVEHIIARHRGAWDALAKR